MSVTNLPISPEIALPQRKPAVGQKSVCLLLTTLAALIVGCQSPPPATEPWTPAYLRADLSSGGAQVRWPDATDWIAIEGGSGIVIQDKAHVRSDAVAGAQFRFGDGSTLELAPGTVVELLNLRTYPRLRVRLVDGNITFAAEEPSYEFALPTCPATLLSVPAQIRMTINDEAVHLFVGQGAVNCALETGAITVVTCQEITARPGEEPVLTEFCSAPTSTPTIPSLPLYVTSSPTGTSSPTAMPSASPSPLPPSPSPTPTQPRVMRTATPSPTPETPTPTPTMTPLPPPPPPPPPPTQPPPAPTSPPPPPTDTPAPLPTDTPERPTPTPERGTPGP